MTYPAARRARRAKKPDRSTPLDSGKYVVVGPRAVNGVQPGETIDFPLSIAQARSLVQAGHIAIAETTKEER